MTAQPAPDPYEYQIIEDGTDDLIPCQHCGKNLESGICWRVPYWYHAGPGMMILLEPFVCSTACVTALKKSKMN